VEYRHGEDSEAGPRWKLQKSFPVLVRQAVLRQATLRQAILRQAILRLDRLILLRLPANEAAPQRG
jgi:hypothetical protein